MRNTRNLFSRFIGLNDYIIIALSIFLTLSFMFIFWYSIAKLSCYGPISRPHILAWDIINKFLLMNGNQVVTGNLSNAVVVYNAYFCTAVGLSEISFQLPQFIIYCIMIVFTVFLAYSMAGLTAAIIANVVIIFLPATFGLSFHANDLIYYQLFLTSSLFFIHIALKRNFLYLMPLYFIFPISSKIPFWYSNEIMFIIITITVSILFIAHHRKYNPKNTYVVFVLLLTCTAIAIICALPIQTEYFKGELFSVKYFSGSILKNPAAVLSYYYVLVKYHVGIIVGSLLICSMAISIVNKRIRNDIWHLLLGIIAIPFGMALISKKNDFYIVSMTPLVAVYISIVISKAFRNRKKAVIAGVLTAMVAFGGFLWELSKTEQKLTIFDSYFDLRPRPYLYSPCKNIIQPNLKDSRENMGSTVEYFCGIDQSIVYFIDFDAHVGIFLSPNNITIDWLQYFQYSHQPDYMLIGEKDLGNSIPNCIVYVHSRGKKIWGTCLKRTGHC